MTREHAALELRYRRLLALYPMGHQAEYGEDMLGTLMADARPGQLRPVPAVTADLLRGALRAWGARLSSWVTTGSAGVVAIFALLYLSLVATNAIGTPFIPEEYYGHPDSRLIEYITLAPDISWLLAAVLAVVGLGRTAAAVAWVAGLALPAIGASLNSSNLWQFYDHGLNVTVVALELLAAVGLTLDPGLRKGARALGRRPLLIAGAGLLLVQARYLADWFVEDQAVSTPSCVAWTVCGSPVGGLVGLVVAVLATALFAWSALAAVARLAEDWLRAFAVIVAAGLLFLVYDAVTIGGRKTAVWQMESGQGLSWLPVLLFGFLATHAIAHARIEARPTREPVT